MVDGLSGDEAKEILKEIAKDTPGVLLAVRDKRRNRESDESIHSDDENSFDHHPEPEETQGWCFCTRCPAMPSDAEKLCCGMSRVNCLSIVPEMELVILDPMVLHIQMLYRNDMFAINAAQDTDVNKGKRHAAYRQFVLWQHQRLGRGDRRVVPACCVKAIRDRYPDPTATYTGFIPGRLN